MTFLSDLRDRLPGRTPAAAHPDGTDSTGNGVADMPIKGYDKLNGRQVMRVLSDHTQVELESIEVYERSNQDRKEVLDKLRYMRGPEPIEGYDAMNPDDLVVVLESADLVTIKKVRSYENKFAGRAVVVTAIDRLHDEALAGRPPRAPLG